jgi:hypothetical protein
MCFHNRHDCSVLHDLEFMRKLRVQKLSFHTFIIYNLQNLQCILCSISTCSWMSYAQSRNSYPCFCFTFFFSHPLWSIGLISQFYLSFLQTVGLFGRLISSSQGPYLNTGLHKHRINAYTHQTSMSCVGFEFRIPASERAKTVHGLDRFSWVPLGDLWHNLKLDRNNLLPRLLHLSTDYHPIIRCHIVLSYWQHC